MSITIVWDSAGSDATYKVKIGDTTKSVKEPKIVVQGSDKDVKVDIITQKYGCISEPTEIIVKAAPTMTFRRSFSTLRAHLTPTEKGTYHVKGYNNSDKSVLLFEKDFTDDYVTGKGQEFPYLSYYYVVYKVVNGSRISFETSSYTGKDSNTINIKYEVIFEHPRKKTPCPGYIKFTPKVNDVTYRIQNVTNGTTVEATEHQSYYSLSYGNSRGCGVMSGTHVIIYALNKTTQNIEGMLSVLKI